jgi:hypothetical protein
MFRAQLAQAEGAVYTLCWSAESEQILFSSGKHLVIRPLTPSSKQTMWKAHDAPVLSAEWNAVNNLIVSGGEDCKCACRHLHPLPLLTLAPLPLPSGAFARSLAPVRPPSHPCVRRAREAGIPLSRRHPAKPPHPASARS